MGAGPIVADDDENVPRIGLGGGAAKADLAESDVFLRRADGEDAEIGREPVERGLLFGDAAGTGEDDLARALRLLLGDAGVIESLFQIQGGSRGLGFADRLFDDGVLGFEGSGGRGESVGADEHHAVAGGKRAQVGAGGGSGFVEQRALAGPRTHPGGGIEDQNVIAAGAVDDAEAGARDGGEEQKKADEFEDEAPGLLDAAAVFKLGANVGADPESQGRNNLVTLGAVEQIERDDAGRNGAGEAQKLAEAEIEKIHCNTPLATSELK